MPVTTPRTLLSENNVTTGEIAVGVAWLILYIVMIATALTRPAAGPLLAFATHY